MDRSSKQNINKDVVALNNVLDQMNLNDIHIEPFIPKKQNTHYFQMPIDISKDRPHDRTQNKLQQIQENWNHIKHFLEPQGTETRNQPQGKNPPNTQTHGDWIAWY